MKTTSTTIRSLAVVAVLTALLPGLGVAPSAMAETVASDDTALCASMTTDIHQSVNPTTGASLLTRWTGEIESAASRHGFTERRGVAFKASATQQPGLVPVHRLVKKGQFVWIPDKPHSSEFARAVTVYGYTDQGVNFYAAPHTIDCGAGVEVFRRGGTHRATADPGYGAALLADGWVAEGPKYWGTAAGPGGPPIPPPVTPPLPPQPGPEDGIFSIAVIPDTQQEVFADRPDGTNSRFSGRTRWLVDNEDRYDLRYVVHSGDVVNWDTPDHAQYEVARKGIRVLEDAQLETSLAIGNHDTAAVGPGGSAADHTRTRQLVRDTSTFNAYFPTTANAGLEGTFEPGKIDNNFHTFEAGGVDWLVLTLELWPRVEAVQWARGVVAAHPRHNVIINTHAYLTADGSIAQNSDYGVSSPQYLYDNLVKVYPNIKMVFSGHVGQAAAREDTGVNGNRIFSYLGAFHSNVTNPVRILEIDTRAGTLKSAIHAPSLGAIWTQYDRSTSGLEVIR